MDKENNKKETDSDKNSLKQEDEDGKLRGRQRLLIQILLGFSVVVILGKTIQVLTLGGELDQPGRYFVGFLVAAYFATELYHDRFENGENVRRVVNVVFLVGASSYLVWEFILK